MNHPTSDNLTGGVGQQALVPAAIVEPRAVALIGLALAAAPLAWLAGLFMFWFHLLAFAAAIMALSAAPASRGTGNVLSLLALLYAVCCMLSVTVNSIGDTVSRTIEGYYLASYWFMGAATCYVAAQQDPERARGRLVFAAHGVAIVTLAIAAIGLFAWFGLGVRQIDFKSPAALALGPAALKMVFSEHMILPLLGSDYFAGQWRPRVTTFAQYPVPTAVLLAMLLPCLWVYRKDARKVSTTLWLLALVGVAVGMALANSRTTYLGASLAFGIAWLVYRRRLLQAVVLLLPIALLLTPLLGYVLDDVAAAREGSTHTRLTLYAYGFDRVMSEAPLLGFGLPRRVPGWHIPIGSHSTILGALYRNGLTGFTVLVTLIAAITLYWFRAMRIVAAPDIRLFLAVLGGPLLLLDFVIFTEDLDWPQMLCFIYFFMQGSMVAAVRADAAIRARDPAAGFSAFAAGRAPGRAAL